MEHGKNARFIRIVTNDLRKSAVKIYKFKTAF